MIPQIISVTKPSIDLTAFAKNATAVLGFNPLRTTDALGRELSNEARFIAALVSFRDRTEDPIKGIRNAGIILRALHYGFLVACDRETVLGVIQSSKLAVITSGTVDQNLAVHISGDLFEWQQTIIELSHDDIPRHTRLLINTIFVWFERNGLGEVFGNYRKVQLKDHTLRLEDKR